MPGKKDKLLKYFLEVPVFGTLVYHMIVSRENINNLFIENMFFDPFHPDQNMLDAYYEAAHKGGAQAKAAYASKASRFMNINILPALKNIDNSIFIIEGEAENNGDEVIAAYQEANPSIEAVMILIQNIFLMWRTRKNFWNRPESFFKGIKIRKAGIISAFRIFYCPLSEKEVLYQYPKITLSLLQLSDLHWHFLLHCFFRNSRFSSFNRASQAFARSFTFILFTRYTLSPATAA